MAHNLGHNLGHKSSKFCNIWVIDTSNTRCSNIDNPKVKSEDCISEEISLSASQTNNIKQ